jgi:hypothetical protein
MVGGKQNEDRFVSSIYADTIDDFEQMEAQSSNRDVKVYSGSYPHIHKLQYDFMSENIAGFTDFKTLKVFPLLHLRRIKVKVGGIKTTDNHIVAIKLLNKGYMITADSDNYLRAW